MAFHTSLSGIFSRSLCMAARTTILMVIFAPSIILVVVPLFSFLSTPKITQPFPLVGHDIYYYYTAVMHLQNYSTNKR